MEPKIGKGELAETKTFTKSIMSTIVILYFFGFILGSILVIMSANTDIKLGSPVDSSMFMAYAAYIGGPTATAIGFYAWKSKAENMIKLSNSFGSDTKVQIMETISKVEVNS